MLELEIMNVTAVAALTLLFGLLCLTLDPKA